MIFLKKKKKVSPRRQKVLESISSEKLSRMSEIVNSAIPLDIVIMVLFILSATFLLGLDTSSSHLKMFKGVVFRPWYDILSIGAIVTFVSMASAFYTNLYQPRIISKARRVSALGMLFLILLIPSRIGSLYPEWIYTSTGSAVTCAVILTIAYNNRYALGMSIFYSILACFAVGKVATVELFLTMLAGITTCCFFLGEIRTRMKLVEVTAFAALAVLITAVSMGILQKEELGLTVGKISFQAGSAAAVTVAIGIVIQVFLPVIEKVFGIATSMTLLDYSDANQPLLKKLAMDAPGTFSHSLLIGSIAEAAAESIKANGLLCRVGSYYHDIGKINKPAYFVENQMGASSRHEQLSPAMSQLIIVGHVKDGIEIAREFKLPGVLQQFVETHHGTTLIEYFYNEARKKQTDKDTPVSESEFRYPGPKPRSKEAAIVMLADAAESAARSLSDTSPTKIEALVHNMAMKRLQDGQFDECDLTLRDLSTIEHSLAKSLAAHHHGRIAYPKIETDSSNGQKQQKNGKNGNVNKDAEQ